jgi:hypothetical protein
MVFDGPLLLQHNTKSVDDCPSDVEPIDYNNPPWTWPNKTRVLLEDSASGLQAANTTLLFNGSVTLLSNTQGAIAVAASTAVFKGAVTAANNQGSGGVFSFISSAVDFTARFTCSQHAESSDVTPAQQSQQESDNCLDVKNSAVVFHGSVVATRNVQVACPWEYCGPCIHYGGAALSCDNSSVRFRSQATFTGNTKKAIQSWAGTWGIGSIGGGAWNLKGCRVVAEQRVRFLNNSATSAGGRRDTRHARQFASVCRRAPAVQQLCSHWWRRVSEWVSTAVDRLANAV